MELHERLEGHVAERSNSLNYALFWPIVAQIVVLDAVFSLDAVITAVGMVDDLSIMMVAVIFSIGIMIVASKPLTHFVNSHPSVIMLCLGFLMMIGFSLTAEGLGFRIPKGYLYVAIGFSILIELFNQIARRRRKRSLQGQHTARVRTAHAVMRLLGGGKLEQAEVGEEVVDMVAGQDAKPVFDRNERVMISGVLHLAERTVRTIMTPASETDHVDLSGSRAALEHALVVSAHSRLPVNQNGRVSDSLHFVHKKDVLKALLHNSDVGFEQLARPALRLASNLTVLHALEQMRRESTHIAFVVNERDRFVGLLTVTDIMESIAGELPDFSDNESISG